MTPLPQNLFPSFGTQSGRSFSPGRLTRLQGPGSIPVLHHSAVRGHPYSCRTVRGLCAPGVSPCNDKAPFELMSPLCSFWHLPLWLYPVFPLPPQLCLSSLFSPQSHLIHRVCCRSKLCLCPLPVQRPSVYLCTQFPAPSCLSPMPWSSLVSAFNMMLMWYDPKSLTAHKTEGETKASQIFRHRSLTKSLHFSLVIPLHLCHSCILPAKASSPLGSWSASTALSWSFCLAQRFVRALPSRNFTEENVAPATSLLSTAWRLCNIAGAGQEAPHKLPTTARAPLHGGEFSSLSLISN